MYYRHEKLLGDKKPRHHILLSIMFAFSFPTDELVISEEERQKFVVQHAK